jgi:hypothetical protein
LDGRKRSKKKREHNQEKGNLNPKRGKNYLSEVIFNRWDLIVT